MKRKIFFTILTAAVLTFTFSFSVFAQYYKDDATGISLVISDNWSYIDSGVIGNTAVCDVAYRYKYNDNEFVDIYFDNSLRAEYGSNVAGVNTEMFSDDDIKDAYGALMDNDTIADGFNAPINIKVESEISSREMINNVQFFRTEKAYTGTNEGYYPYHGYATSFVGIKDGISIIVLYHRDDNYNHFSDVYAMMQSITFPTTEKAVLTSSNGISIVMNGEYIYPDSPPIMQNDRVLVPIRAVAEKMGYTVVWNEEKESVTMLNGSGTDRVAMYIGGKYCFHNYDMFEMDVAPTVIGDRTYIPLRAAAEAFGANVSWDDPTQTVYISY